MSPFLQTDVHGHNFVRALACSKTEVSSAPSPANREVLIEVCGGLDCAPAPPDQDVGVPDPRTSERDIGERAFEVVIRHNEAISGA